jgi:hypothetical protein
MSGNKAFIKLFVPKKSMMKYFGYYKIRNLLIYTHQLVTLVQKALKARCHGDIYELVIPGGK